MTVEGPQAFEGLGVDLDLVGPEGEAGQAVEGLEGRPGLHGHHLAEGTAGLPVEVGDGPAEVAGQAGEALTEPWARDDLGDDPVGVAVGAAGGALGGGVGVGHAHQSGTPGRGLPPPAVSAVQLDAVEEGQEGGEP